MRKFRSLKDLERYVQSKVEKAITSQEVAHVFQDAMKESVEDKVYEVYEPVMYARRKENDGLSDTGNMVFTERYKSGKTLVSLFENLTVGSNSPVYGYSTDSMSGHFISELIEKGSHRQHNSSANSENGWYDSNGEWSKARPFANYTSMLLNSEPHYNGKLKRTLEKQINS